MIIGLSKQNEQYKPLTTNLLQFFLWLTPNFLWPNGIPSSTGRSHFEFTPIYKEKPQIVCTCLSFMKFDFSTTPLTQPGTRVLAIKKFPKSSTLVDQAFEHYRCVTVYFQKTISRCTVDTVRYL